MKLSTQAVKYINEHYGSAGDPAPQGVDELAKTIGAQLAAVEEIVDFGTRFDAVIIVKVVTCEQHPGADRLHVCKVDDGGVAQGIERDANGLVQIVCGAPNVHAGMLAAWLPPGSTVPSSIGADPFVLEARDLRGVVSNGMMASPRELSLSDNHDYILEIDEELGPITPGTMFADAFHLRGDVIIDMENKMFTHRPDCFGWLGLAREIEGIQHRPYKSPDWYTTNPTSPGPEADELPFRVENEIPQLVPRFAAIVLRDIQVKPSPAWLQIDLARVGLKSINNIVDYTNFYMLLTGQPIHAYDYDKVKALCGGEEAVLTVRYPREGEKIKLLNGKEITPRKEAMMVAAGDHLACLGGAMGGIDTEVDQNTKNIIIEAANWDMFSMRRTAMEHGIFTDAVTRFNKGQSPLQNLATIAKIVDQICSHAGGKVASPLVDINHVPAEAIERGALYPPVTITTQFINERLGWNLSAEEMKVLLTNVEFGVDVDDDTLTVTAPFWRTDIEIPEDIVEEIGRLNGYDKLPLDLPKRDLTPQVRNPMLELKCHIRDVLAASGANEVLTYNFVHGNLLDKVGQSRDQAFQLGNAISPDLQYYRLSLAPSLLDRVHPNIKTGHNQFAVFELGKAHVKGVEDEENLPREFERLAFVYTADTKAADSGAAYYQARTYLMQVLHGLGLDQQTTFEPLSATETDVAAVYYEPGRAATVKIGDMVIGRIGECKASVRKALKLPQYTAGFELGLAPLLAAQTAGGYKTLPRFPKVEQDICLKVSNNTPYAQLFQFVADHLQQNRPDQTAHSLSPVDIYQREDDPDHKQITLRLSIASFDRTLTDTEVNKLLDHIAQAAKESLGAERI